MDNDRGRHSDRELATGHHVYLVKPPGEKWQIKSYDRSWADGWTLMRATAFAEDLGWSDRRFDTEDDAYAFAEREIRGGRGARMPVVC